MNRRIVDAKRKLRPNVENWSYYSYATKWNKFLLPKLLSYPQISRNTFLLRIPSTTDSNEFAMLFEKAKRPCILCNVPIPDLSCLSNPRLSLELGRDDSNSPINIHLKDFLYYQLHQKDDFPLYVFDPHRFIPFPSPTVFTQDFFATLNRKRPPFRWLLMGPTRSGSGLHVDPLQTSAWNALFKGRKLWVLFSHTISPSILKHQPQHALEWFLSDFERVVQKLPSNCPWFCFIQEPGEVVYIPNGYWHAVVNLEDTVAMTQNFVSLANVGEVWKSLCSERKKLAKQWKQSLRGKQFDNVHEVISTIDLNEGFDLQRELDLEWIQRRKDKKTWRSRARLIE